MGDIKNDLPEGVEFVRIGVAGDQDFEMVGPVMRKGKRSGAAAGVLVRPAEGYSFQPARVFDINSYTFKDGPEGTYMAVKQFPQPLPIKCSVSFAITNEFDRQIVADVLTKLQALPGYVESKIE